VFKRLDRAALDFRLLGQPERVNRQHQAVPGQPFLGGGFLTPPMANHLRH